MATTIEMAVSLGLFFLFFSIIGAVACGVSYRKKQKPLISGLFLGGFIGLLVGMFVLGAVVFLLLL